MNRPVLTLVSIIALAGAPALAQEFMSRTDVAPYTDIQPARTAAGAPSYWKGSLTRAEVLEAMRAARASGTIATGDAVGYPFPLTAAEQVAAPPAGGAATVLGGPPSGEIRTIDGYRFVGGEAGYAR